MIEICIILITGVVYTWMLLNMGSRGGVDYPGANWVASNIPDGYYEPQYHDVNPYVPSGGAHPMLFLVFEQTNDQVSYNLRDYTGVHDVCPRKNVYVRVFVLL